MIASEGVARPIPCPLTLFAMTYAAAKDSALARASFAAMSMLGVAVVLGAVALSR